MGEGSGGHQNGRLERRYDLVLSCGDFGGGGGNIEVWYSAESGVPWRFGRDKDFKIMHGGLGERLYMFKSKVSH